MVCLFFAYYGRNSTNDRSNKQLNNAPTVSQWTHKDIHSHSVLPAIPFNFLLLYFILVLYVRTSPKILVIHEWWLDTKTKTPANLASRIFCCPITIYETDGQKQESRRRAENTSLVDYVEQRYESCCQHRYSTVPYYCIGLKVSVLVVYESCHISDTRWVNRTHLVIRMLLTYFDNDTSLNRTPVELEQKYHVSSVLPFNEIRQNHASCWDQRPSTWQYTCRKP